MKSGISGKVVDRDKGAKALLRRVADTGKIHVAVGLTGVKAEAQHGSEDFNNVDIGTVHEFGLGNVPERSFIRATVDDRSKEIQSIQRRIAAGIVSGKTTEEKGLTILGLKLQADMVAKIRSNIPPALSPETIKQKRSSTPLIDSGQLVQAISFQVRKGDPR